jgi:hypothetical protein
MEILLHHLHRTKIHISQISFKIIVQNTIKKIQKYILIVIFLQIRILKY